LNPATFLWNPFRDPSADPLVPMGQASRAVSGFRVRNWEGVSGPNEQVIIGDWPTMPFLIHHVMGYTSRHGHSVPSRDIVGIRAEAWGRIGDAFDRFVDGLLSGA
jgi:hypothetical protein